MELDASGKDGKTLLWSSVEANDLESFRFLLGKGASAMCQTSAGLNTMELCASNDNPGFIKSVLEHGGRVNLISQYYRRTPLFSAAVANSIENTKVLIDNGAYLDISDPFGMTPVMAAARVNSYEVVVLLLQRGANYEYKDRTGETLADIVRSSQIPKTSERFGAYMKTLTFLMGKGAI
jgi:ankyrin repeat protein